MHLSRKNVEKGEEHGIESNARTGPECSMARRLDSCVIVAVSRRITDGMVEAARDDLAQSELSRALLSFGKGRDKRAASIQSCPT